MIYFIVFVIIIAIIVVLVLLIRKRDSDIEIINRALIIPALFTALIVIATYSTNRNNFDSISIVIEFVGIIMVFMTYVAHRNTQAVNRHLPNRNSISYLCTYWICSGSCN